MKNKIINANGTEIRVYGDVVNEDAYISLTDIAKTKNSLESRVVISNWLSSYSTIDFLALWESLYNPNFNRMEFHTVRNESGRLVMTPTRWIEKMNARLKKMAREDNVAVFEDTEKLCKENGRLSEAVSTSLLNQQIILEKDTLGEIVRDCYSDEAKLVVSMKRSYEAAKAYKGTRTAVHNFASATNPGGGVKKGSGAQEECLCRCSTLYFDLDTKDAWSKFYTPHRAAKDPIHNSDIIYTPGVIVFKTDTAYPLKMQEKDWYQVDVITCAAPNLKSNPTNQFNPGDGDKQVKITDNELLAIHEKRLHRILDVAVLNGVESIVLGAFGCGAFKNKPEVVALAAKNVIKDYLHSFKNIEFAVYCRPNDDRNYKVFERTLGKMIE